MVNDFPVQILPLLTAMVGVGLIETVAIAGVLLTHPKALVPMTLQEVVLDGETVLLPLEYVQVNAPLGVIVNVLLGHIAPLFTLITGAEFTKILLLVIDLIHPLVPVPVKDTEYEPAVLGKLNTAVVPVMLPGIHVYVDAVPEAVHVAVFTVLLQKAPELVADPKETEGNALTATIQEAV